MKLRINLAVGNSWKFYFIIIICVNIFKKSDVLAISKNKSQSKIRFPASTVARKTASSSPTNSLPGRGIPSSLLSEIRSLDNKLLCFPKLLCTIYQDDSITRRVASLNATELGIAYMKLLKAVHYTSPNKASALTKAGVKVKQPIIQIFQIPTGIITSSTYAGRKDHSDGSEDYPYRLRSPIKGAYGPDSADGGWGGGDDDDDFSLESENPLGNDDEEREFLKEKLEISQMMQEEEAAEHPDDSSGHGSFGSAILNTFLPFMGSRSINVEDYSGTKIGRTLRQKDRKERVQVITQAEIGSERKSRRNQPGVPQDPFWRAVSLWRKLKSRNQCRELYKTCPFEAWEIVRMLDLVKGQSKILSTYLKITVDNVRPASLKH